MTAALLRFNRRTFSSLRYRNYRLFFSGQAVSQTGSWMQRIALGWFVLQLTHSAFAVGIMAVAQFLPFTMFGLFGGVLVDRLDARRTVIGTQVAQLGTAIVRPFASIDEWIMRRPWQTIRAAMQEELVDFSWTELSFGTAFLAAGSRRPSNLRGAAVPD